MRRFIISLCDYSGNWVAPFREFGYTTIQVDIKLETSFVGNCWTIGCSVEEFFDVYIYLLDGYFVDGVLMAPPCTDFTNSCSRTWDEKDRRGITDRSLMIVDCCLAIKDHFNPVFWCLENPKGRLPKLRPLGAIYSFHPNEFAEWADDPSWEAYKKQTCLWGSFAPPVKERYYRVAPNDKQGFGAVLLRTGRNEEATKEIRSITPTGFSRAFAYAQLPRLAKEVKDGQFDAICV